MFSRIAQSTRSFFRSVSREVGSDNDSTDRQHSVAPEASIPGMVITRSDTQNLESSPGGVLDPIDDIHEPIPEEASANISEINGTRGRVPTPKVSRSSPKDNINNAGSVVPDSQAEVDVQRLALRPHDAQQDVGRVRQASFPSDLEYIHGTQATNDTQGSGGRAQPAMDMGGLEADGIENEFQRIENGVKNTSQPGIQLMQPDHSQGLNVEIGGIQVTNCQGVNNEGGEILSTTESNVQQRAPIHKRFGSVEFAVPGTQLGSGSQLDGINSNNLESQNLADDEEESSDEEPEIVTAATGQRQNRHTAAEEVKAAQRQALVKKEKRRKHASHLKEQAKLAKKKRSKTTTATTSPPSDKNAEQHTKFDVRSILKNGKLPDLLPDEILAEEPPSSIPVLPAKLQPKAPVSNKRKFIDADPKPPKDIRVGNKVIRVVQTTRTVLPPRSSKKSKTIRESWLNGERGGNGSMASKRRKVGGGFLRG